MEILPIFSYWIPTSDLLWFTLPCDIPIKIAELLGANISRKKTNKSSCSQVFY